MALRIAGTNEMLSPGEMYAIVISIVYFAASLNLDHKHAQPSRPLDHGSAGLANLGSYMIAPCTPIAIYDAEHGRPSSQDKMLNGGLHTEGNAFLYVKHDFHNTSADHLQVVSRWPWQAFQMVPDGSHSHLRAPNAEGLVVWGSKLSAGTGRGTTQISQMGTCLCGE